MNSLGQRVVQALCARYPALSQQEAASEIWDFVLLALGDRQDPEIGFPDATWFDAGVVIFQEVLCGWTPLDQATQRLSEAMQWYLEQTTPLGPHGAVSPLTRSAIEQRLSILDQGSSESILLPITLDHRDGNHVIGLHLSAVWEEVHLVLLDSSPPDCMGHGEWRSCCIHARLSTEQLLSWFKTRRGQDVLCINPLGLGRIEDLAEQMAPFTGSLDWSRAAWGYHETQIHHSCVPSMIALAWQLEYAHPCMRLPARTDGLVQAGHTLAQWYQALWALAKDLCGFLPDAKQPSTRALEALERAAAEYQQLSQATQMHELQVPLQLGPSIGLALVEGCRLAQSSLQETALQGAAAAISAAAAERFKLLQIHLSRLEPTSASFLSDSAWLLGRFTSRLVVDSSGACCALATLPDGDRRIVNLIKIIRRNITKNRLGPGFTRAARRWARRIVACVEALEAPYPQFKIKKEPEGEEN